MRRYILAFALILLVASARASSPDGPVLVGTWNLQNYLLQIRFPEGRFRPAYPMPEAQKKQIRHVILESRPDVLFLQELGSSAFLKELQLDLAASGLSYPYAAFSAAPGARSGLAVLSLFPPDEVVFHDPIPLPNDAVLPRGIQEVRFTLANLPLRFFHLHLKSRYSADPNDPDSRALRTAGFQALRQFLDRFLSVDLNAALILVGDFNTPLDDPLLHAIQPRWQRLPVADATGQAWTYLHRKSGSREVLDAFWLSPAAAPMFFPVTLLPADLSAAPSDHRLVLARFCEKGLATPP